ncbi:hypothetical protein Cgig2_027889 [Carnegiea gigantea]|uniref:Uncharacterized protein n=1 Tax=Carnegiea gigantea TaxID=171969 RepID=A0A9Q1KLW4_9CARY|nr:hypothetical protein Cgig2_027889 [Carnegiea gigantea]
MYLFYLDRVEFKDDKVERWFPIAINWPTDKLKWTCNNTLKNWMRYKINKEYLLNPPQQLQQKSINVHIVHIAKENFKALYLSRMSQWRTKSQQQAQGDKTRQIQIQSSHPPTSWQLESMAKEKMQSKKRMDFTPPSFNLGISPEKVRCASCSLDITPTMVYYQRTCQPTENADNLGKSQGSIKQMHKVEKEKPQHRNAKGAHGITKQPMRKDLLEIQANKKGKKVVVRQLLKRIVKEMPFLCRTPFLKDYKEARNRLKRTQMMLEDYAFLSPDKFHPST